MHSDRTPPLGCVPQKLNDLFLRGKKRETSGRATEEATGRLDGENRNNNAYPGKLTVLLFGKRALKNITGNKIFRNNVFVTMENELVWEESSSFKIINTPDFFDEESQHPDQDIIDIMAVSHPGPDLLILAIDSENTQEEQVVAQITKLQDAFGEEVTAHLVVMSPDIESSHSLIHLKEKFNIKLAIATEDLVSGCKRWCRGHQSFQYEYNNYSQNVVRRRRTALEKRCSVPPLCHHERADAAPLAPSTFAAPAKAELEYHIGNSACGVPDDSIFNIVLLGLTGTGKSASANTILAAGNSHLDPVQPFKTEPSSMPVTTQCEVKMIKKGFGIQVRVVDTPDFFHEQLKNTQAHVEECKRYCQQRKCVMLLVLQLGRFVDEEEGILEKLEMKLGVKIRDSTIVLLTHGEDLEGNLEQYIDVRAPLKNLVKSCGGRYHLFSNKSKDTKQVIELIKKIPNSEEIFPKCKKKPLQCFIC